MKTAIQVHEAKLCVSEDRGGKVPMTLRFPDGTWKEFEGTAESKAVVIATVVMDWVRSHEAGERMQWIAALKDAQSPALNHLFCELLMRQVTADKAGRAPD